MPIRRPARPWALLPALLLLLAGLGSAEAADERPVELPLLSGKTVTGIVESAGAREVVVRTAPETVRRLPWTTLAPLGVFRVKRALAPAADGEARLALGELAVELGLHREAREEFEKALALGSLESGTFAKLVRKAEHDAVDAGVRQAMMAAESGDLERALDTARQLKLDFASAPNAGRIDDLLEDLLDTIETIEAESAEAAAELQRVRVEAERNKEILRRQLMATDQIEKGRGEAEDAARAREIGNVTRARKHGEKADESFARARRHLGRLRRILPREHEMQREILAMLNELDRMHFDLLYQTAYFFWRQTVYTRADEFAARASYIDPVHPDLLELRDHLRQDRIRFRLSDVTNARPIIR